MSTTGAGLGQVSNLELTQLNNSLVALQQELTPELLEVNQQKLETVYTKRFIRSDCISNKRSPDKRRGYEINYTT